MKKQREFGEEGRHTDVDDVDDSDSDIQLFWKVSTDLKTLQTRQPSRTKFKSFVQHSMGI